MRLRNKNNANTAAPAAKFSALRFDFLETCDIWQLTDTKIGAVPFANSTDLGEARYDLHRAAVGITDSPSKTKTYSALILSVTYGEMLKKLDEQQIQRNYRAHLENLKTAIEKNAAEIESGFTSRYGETECQRVKAYIQQKFA